MNETKLGRYEKGLSYTNFKRIGEDKIEYSYGTVGFAKPSGIQIIDDYSAERKFNTLWDLGYVKADETPVSETDHKDAGILLDWIAGVKR